MTTITLTNIDSLDPHNFELLSAYLAKKGVEFEINQTEPISAPKQKKSAPKSKTKSSDDFDRTKYVQVASVLGCYGKKGVWKSCRAIVYAVMGYKPEVYGNMTIEEGQKAVADLKASKGWA